MPSRSLNVVISGDARQLNGALTSAGKHMEGLEKRGHHMSGVLVKGFALAGAAAGTALVVGLKKSASAAMEAEKSHARLEAQLKASGISYRAHAREIDNVIQKTSKLAGLDDEDLQDAFTNIVRSTGSVSKGLRGIGLAADIARAKHIDVAKAGQLVGKVASGNVTALARYGIQIDKNATSSQALAELQKRFAGQAEAYGKTAAGAQDRFRVAVENLEEKLGAVLLPVLAKVARGVAKFLEGIESGRGVGGRFAKAIGDAFNTIKSVVGSSVTAVRGFLARNRDDIQSVERAVRNVARAVKAVIENVLIPAFRILLPAVRDVVEGMLRSIRGLVRIVSGVLTGDWSKAWDGIKDVVKGSLKAIVALLKGAGELLVKAAGAAGEGIAKGILSGLGSLGHLLLDAVKKAVGWVAGKVGSVGSSIGKALNPFGDGLGASMMPSIPGLGGGGSLMGADQDLQPFASLAAGMGLHTTSGLRPGSITSSGNVSWHSSGDAIDEAGPLPAMRRYAQTLHDRFGGRLRELISPWPELGIKDGHPFRYSGRVQADHSGANAHVHVAYTGPFGDGLGQIESLWQQAGGRRSAAAMAAAIAMAESGGNPGISHRNSDGSIDRGLWQINSVHGRMSTFNRLANARAAVSISGNGRDWNPWTVFKTGAYRRYLSAAQAALGGGGGSGGSRAAAPAGNRDRSVANAFNVAAGLGREAGTLAASMGGGTRGFPIRKGISGQSGGGGPTDTEAGTDDNTAALDALNAQIAELTRQMEEAARLAEQQNALLKQQRDDANRAYAVSQSQYGTFKGFFAEMVNDYLGSRVGLGMAGLRAPAGTLMRA